MDSCGKTCPQFCTVFFFFSKPGCQLFDCSAPVVAGSGCLWCRGVGNSCFVSAKKSGAVYSLQAAVRLDGLPGMRYSLQSPYALISWIIFHPSRRLMQQPPKHASLRLSDTRGEWQSKALPFHLSIWSCSVLLYRCSLTCSQQPAMISQ